MPVIRAQADVTTAATDSHATCGDTATQQEKKLASVVAAVRSMHSSEQHTRGTAQYLHGVCGPASSQVSQTSRSWMGPASGLHQQATSNTAVVVSVVAVRCCMHSGAACEEYSSELQKHHV